MKSFLDPTEILKRLKLRKDMIAADFGSGSGGWAIPLAEKLEEGKVYAVDLLEEPLSALRARAKTEKISNIQTVLANVEKGVDTLREASCNLVLMTNLFSQCQDIKKILSEGQRVLKPDGRILIVDWQRDNPLTEQVEKVSFEEIKKTASEFGLKIEKEFDAGSYHYAMVFTKN
ncbi:MAG: class I SAM-dependent methyltransferase [bacterium]|nr:class I SAM-dependent methyltransferase [bacterium]